MDLSYLTARLPVLVGSRLVSVLRQFRNDAKARDAAPTPVEVPTSRPAVGSACTQRARICRVIEFVGAPGSGKSTIEYALREALLTRDYKPVPPYGTYGNFNRWARIGPHRSPLTPIFLLARVVAGGRGTRRFFFKVLRRDQPPRTLHFQYRSLSTALVLAAKHAWLTRMLRSGSGDYALFCQFFINSLTKLIALNKLALQGDTARLFSFYDDVNVLFVYVDTPVEVSLRRLRLRARVTSPVQRMEGQQGVEYIRTFKRVSELCAERAAAHSGARILRVSGVGSVEVTIQRLLREIGEVSQCVA